MLARPNLEFLIVCESGSVFLLDCQTRQHRQVSHLDFPFNYDSETFNYLNKFRNEQSPLSIRSHGNYVCIAQTYGQTGAVLDLDDPKFKLLLHRGDYQVEHCRFPLALYSVDNDTFLIHGTDWNRLDVTNLKSAQILTERVVDYESNSNYFDYFHSSLSISPDSKRFASNGWFWGPCDVITVYEVDEFPSNFELANTQLAFGPVDGYNWDRPMCWIDDHRVGVAYNKQESGEHEGKFSSEILVVDTTANQVVDSVEFDGFAMSEYGAPTGDLHYDIEKGWFISINPIRGLLVADRSGKEIHANPTLRYHRYAGAHRVLYGLSSDGKEIEMMELDLLR